jgi:hypothetical protein
VPVVVPVTEVHVGPGLDQGDVVVSFSRVSRNAVEVGETSAIGFMALGAGPIPQAQEESPL